MEDTAEVNTNTAADLSSSKQLALQTETSDEGFLAFLCHLNASNLTYTLLRSILFVEAAGEDQTLDRLHACGHHTCKGDQISKKTEDEEPEILKYWQESGSKCPNCLVFLSELLASSWRDFGPAISQRRHAERLDWVRYMHFNDETNVIMTNLFGYMSDGFVRLERDTKNALGAEIHSLAFTNACREFWGENFSLNNNKERPEALLANLHESTVNILMARLLGRHHINDTIERDNAVLFKRKPLINRLTIALVEDEDVKSELDVSQTVTKGKNYGRNRRNAEKRKKKRATNIDNSVTEASKEPKDLLEKTGNGSPSSVGAHNVPAMEDVSTTKLQKCLIVFADECISQGDALIETGDDSDIHIKNQITAIVAVQPVKDNSSDPTSSLKPGGCLSKSSTIHNVVEKPVNEVAEDLVKEVTQEPATEIVGKEALEVVETPVDNVVAEIATIVLQDLKNKEVPNQYEDYEAAMFRTEDDTPWTEVLGSHKKVKKTSRQVSNPYGINSSPIKENLRNSQHATRSQGGEKSSVALKTAKGQTCHAQTSGSLHNQYTVSGSTLKSTHPRLSEPKKPVAASIFPKQITPKKKSSSSAIVEQVNSSLGLKPNTKAFILKDHSLPYTVSTTQKNFPISCPVSANSVPEKVTDLTRSPSYEAYSPFTTSSALTNLEANDPGLSTVCTTTQHKSQPLATCTDLRVFIPAVKGSFVAETQSQTKKRESSPLSESVDPGPVPYYQHLKPFRKSARRMSDVTGTPFVAIITPRADTLSLVETLRDAGVDDGAMSSLVSEAAALSMSSSHLTVPSRRHSQRQPFAGSNVDVLRANMSSISAENSPVPLHSPNEPVYHYPPPDILTPQNQEILDLIIKGPPYEKYPRVPPAVSPPEPRPDPAGFFTKPIITSYDNKDAYEVLGNRCPAPLSVMDHPTVNKCIRQNETFHCAYCQVAVSGNAAAEEGIICPGCGPCSTTRYCQRSHLLAHSIDHSTTCGTDAESYPLMWSALPLHYQNLFPYIRPLTGTMTAECFRQMAHCLVINSDGLIENPFKAYFNEKMGFKDKVKIYQYVEQMYQFQDKGHYYLFVPHKLAGGVDVEMTITMHDGSNDFYREDQRFARVRNAAFLTQEPTLLCVIYRRIKDVIKGFHADDDRKQRLMQTFHDQFHNEFPSFNASNALVLDDNYCFQEDWNHVRQRVHDFELGNPILRAWITEDAEDCDIPADPTARYQGKHWDVVHGPTFRAGSVDRRDWGPGWYGMDEEQWQKQLNRKYRKMVTDELTAVETELEGEII